MAKLFRKGNTWWVTYYVGKRRRRESFRTTDIRIAKRKLSRLENEASVGELELPSVTPIVPFLEAFCEHLRTIRPTPKGYKNDISYRRTIFGPVCSALEPHRRVNHRYRAQRRIKVKDQLAPHYVGVSTLEELTAARIEEYITQRIRCERRSKSVAPGR